MTQTCCNCESDSTELSHCSILRVQNEQMREALKAYMNAVEWLDENMATPKQIAEDTRMVGGFVSSLDLLETETQIIDRAVARIRELSAENERLRKALQGEDK
jgi:hypothetical protein